VRGSLLHQAVNFEPVGASAVARAGLGHAHHEALSQPASLAGGSVLLVDDASVVVLAFLILIFIKHIFYVFPTGAKVSARTSLMFAHKAGWSTI